MTKYSVCVLALSIDDFYLPRAAQASLAASHPDNKLLQYRGAPGTHDLNLLSSILRSIMHREETRIPRYDKSAFGRLGDRMPPEDWRLANSSNPSSDRVQIILIEGWCMGFAALTNGKVEAKWKGQSRTLQQHKLKHLLYVNERLRAYDSITNSLDAFVHLDAEEVSWVYEWRLQQERVLRANTGSGMDDNKVEAFVDGYYPAYELYYERIWNSALKNDKGLNLKAILGKDRNLKSVVQF